MKIAFRYLFACSVVYMHYLLIFIAVLFVSCGRPSSSDDKPKKEELSYSGKLFHGKHYLRKFRVTTEESSSWSGGYFLVGGSASGTTAAETLVTFSWKSTKGEYIISKLPLEKIHIKLDSTVSRPYIRFKWGRCNNENYSISYLVAAYVEYIVLYCREEDYPVEINLKDL